MDVQRYTTRSQPLLKHIAFRVDASFEIGTGHVMRCLTLADALRERDAKCTFVCRPHAGHLLELIEQRGHQAIALHKPEIFLQMQSNNDPAHAAWLATSWLDDAAQTRAALTGQQLDWLVVDHYALDRRWESLFRGQARRIMVVDDLADRPHDCDLILDQTYGRPESDYAPLVPDNCQLLCGSQYALLRPDFAVLREYSLRRRTKPVLRELLITMGGVDKDNATGQVLKALQNCALPENIRVTVVMGQSAPWLQEVKELAAILPWSTRVLVGVSDMAQLMADSDLAIGAAGTTSWERCCLGLPSVVLLTAENQRFIFSNLTKNEVVESIDLIDLNFNLKSVINYISSESGLMRYSQISKRVCNGLGAGKLSQIIHEYEKYNRID